MSATSEELERLCCNCNHVFPSEPFESDFAICLNDPDFEPYLDDLLENQDFSRCRQLVKDRRFPWDQEACSDFDPIEFIDLDTPLSSELSNAIKELAGHSADLAVELAGKIVRAELKPDDHAMLIRQAMASFAQQPPSDN